MTVGPETPQCIDGNRSSAMSPDIINYFVHRSAAGRYAAARPYFHPLIAKRIAAFTKSVRFKSAVDVGCGTGQSARAIAEIALSVDAIDISPEMIAHAQPHPRVRYHIAAAEQLPFADGVFDLVAVGLAFHWFDQAKFLCEARRVLESGAWLIIYNSGFAGEMIGNEAFRAWAWEVYPRRFPTPPRCSTPISASVVEPYGFEFHGSEKFAHDENMSAQTLTAYLLTQTNVIAAVESGDMPLEKAARWIYEGVLPFFDGSTRAMKFSGTIWYCSSREFSGRRAF